MKIYATAGCEDIAVVYLADFGDEKVVECVEAVQPPIPREEKWVLLISMMFGCPVQCMMCDAGGFYKGKLSKEEILAQIDFLVYRRYPDGVIPARQFKIQLARMGEPALNPAVNQVLAALPSRYSAPGLMPSFSTIAPIGTERFFDKLLSVKQEYYSGGHFQFQFSIHTTDEDLRDQIIPIKKWDFDDMAAYGERFYQPGDRKITLNFALAKGNPVDAQALFKYFDPDKYLIKITPLNPTHRVVENRLASHIDPHQLSQNDCIVRELEETGYQVIVSIGEVRENLIGSNCGQYVIRHLRSNGTVEEGYTYPVEEFSQG